MKLKTRIFIISAVFCLLFWTGVSRAQGVGAGVDSQTLLGQIASLKQQIVKILTDRIQALTAELNKMTANAAPAAAPTPTPTIIPSSLPARASANSSSRSSVNAFANNPFGGMITHIDESTCDCSGHKFIKITPPKPDLPDTMLYLENTAILYANYQVKEGREVLGTWEQKDTCMKYVTDGVCTPVGSWPLIAMVGTSGNGGSQGGGQTGGGTNPTPRPTVSVTPAPSIPPDACKRMGDQAYNYAARGTGYYPSNSAMEGGFEDMRGAPLRTLQDYLDGKADYVSVAMDQHVFPYGTELCIPQLDQKYGRQIIFRVVDTGGAFTGMGTRRIDICTRNAQASLDGTINGPLNLVSRTPSAQ